MTKYVIELEKIEGTEFYKAKGCNTLVFDKKGIENILTPYEEPKFDWSKVAVDTPILVRNTKSEDWKKRHFSEYVGGKVYTWFDGKTSWSSSSSVGWEYAKLSENNI